MDPRLRGGGDIGLPLGNLTSQLFCNIYLNELDQFVKHKLRARHYIRYADDFVLLSRDRQWLESQVQRIEGFLENKLKLNLHPKKLLIQTAASGPDFLGWVHFSKARVLRAATRKRIMRKIKDRPAEATMQSYLGLLGHGNTHKLKVQILNTYFINTDLC